MTRTFVLKTQSGKAWMAFDREDRARAVLAERAEKNVHLKLVEQTIVERELAA